MRIECPKCDASYDVAPEAIGDAGRTVRCASCSTEWFQQGDRPAAADPAPSPTGGLDEIIGVVAAAAKRDETAAKTAASTIEDSDKRAQDSIMKAFEEFDAPTREAPPTEAIEEARVRVRNGAKAEKPSFDDADDLAMQPRSGGAFLAGFATVTLVALLMIAAYVKAPDIAAVLPAAEGPLDAYKGVVDQGRLALLRATGEQ